MRNPVITAGFFIANCSNKQVYALYTPAILTTTKRKNQAEETKLTYQPKPPRRVILAARVEPRIKAWLKKRFPESISHGVNHILAEHMAKHTKGASHAND